MGIADHGVTVTLTVTLKPEMAEEFAAGLPQAIQPTIGFAGCRDIRVVRHKTERNKFLILETWDSEASYQAYMAWRTASGALEGFARIVTAPPVIDILPTVLAKA